MSCVRTMEIEKVGAPIVVATMVLTFGAMAFLLVRDASAPVDITAPAAVPSYQLAEVQLPSVPALPYRAPDDGSVGRMAAIDLPGAAPAGAAGVDPEPEDASPAAIEQRSHRSRRALETVDARELLRQANLPR